MSPQPGEVWLADLGLAAKTRPVVVVSRHDPNPPRSLVIYVPRSRLRGECARARFNTRRAPRTKARQTARPRAGKDKECLSLRARSCFHTGMSPPHYSLPECRATSSFTSFSSESQASKTYFGGSKPRSLFSRLCKCTSCFSFFDDTEKDRQGMLDDPLY